MTIETRFSLGDKVFVLCNNKVHQVTVTGVYGFQEYTSESSSISYRVKFLAGGEDKFSENALFATKQELLNSL